jgi:hypothetical protein
MKKFLILSLFLMGFAFNIMADNAPPLCNFGADPGPMPIMFYPILLFTLYIATRHQLKRLR